MSAFSTRPRLPCRRWTGSFSKTKYWGLMASTQVGRTCQKPAGGDPEWGVSTCWLARAITCVPGHGAAGCRRDCKGLGPCAETVLLALPKKVTVMQFIKASRCPSCRFLVKVWWIKPRKTFGCVVKAMWCNPVKITDFWSYFCVKSFLPSKTCLQLAVQQPGLCLCCM